MDVVPYLMMCKKTIHWDQEHAISDVDAAGTVAEHCIHPGLISLACDLNQSMTSPVSRMVGCLFCSQIPLGRPT